MEVNVAPCKACGQEIPEDRFWPNIEMTQTCWNWRGAMRPNGYGRIYDSKKKCKAGRQASAHRFAYELLKGPVPLGLVVHHICRNRRCVNPAHLEAVTQRENVHESESPAAQNVRKERCPNGHRYDYARPDGSRGCRQCIKQTSARHSKTRDRTLDNEMRTCAQCGTVFVVNKYQPTRLCSMHCVGIVREAAKRRLKEGVLDGEDNCQITKRG